MIPRFVGGSQGKVSQNVLTRGRGYGMMGTSQMVTKSWNAQPDGRPGGPRKAQESLGGPRKTREGPESLGSPGGPRKAPGRPGSPGRPGKGPDDPGKARKPRRAPEGPGKPRRAPGCKRPCPETGEALPGCLSGRRPACGGQAPGLPVHGLRRAGVPSLSDPAASGLRTGGAAVWHLSKAGCRPPLNRCRAA